MAHSTEAESTVRGRVSEADLQDYGLAGVTVQVEGTDLFATTDADGTFTITGVAAGSLVLVLQAPDYQSTRFEVSASARRYPIAIPLTWVGGDAYAVTVVARRSRPETASTTHLSPRDIMAAPRRNAEEVLRQVPGLTLVQHGSEGKGHQFFLRGFDAIHGADLELTLDGMPLNEWSNVHAQGYLDLGLIIPEMIQGVSVTKGPFTLDQGAFAMAGSANYRLGVPIDHLGWRAAYTVGTTNRHRIFAGYAPPQEGGEQYAAVSATHDDGFGDNRELHRATFNGRVRLFDLEEGGTLYLTGLGTYSTFSLPGTLRNDDITAGQVDFYGTYDPAANGRSARGVLALSYEWQNNEQELSIIGYSGYRRLDLLERLHRLSDQSGRWRPPRPVSKDVVFWRFCHPRGAGVQASQTAQRAWASGRCLFRG